jgi:hypothetical protein
MADTLPLELNDDLREAIGSAFDSANFVLVSYIGDDGWPHVSPRGSAQVLGPQQLGLWIRKRDEGLAAAIGSRPELTFFFMDVVQRGVLYTFYGRGHVSGDPQVIDQVWEATPDREQAQDPERKGVAIVVDLERVVAQSRKPELNYVMQRQPA